MPASPECEDCLLLGIHSRKKRIYYRQIGKYKEIGWFCPTCCTFTLDESSYIADMKTFFNLDLTSEELHKNISMYQKRFAAQKVLRKKIKASEDFKALVTKKDQNGAEIEFIIRKGSPFEKKFHRLLDEERLDD